MLRSQYEWDAFAGQLMQGLTDFCHSGRELGENLERKLHIPKKHCNSVTDVGIAISVTA